MEALAVAMRGGRAWWVAPTYKVAHVGWRLARRLAKQVPGVLEEKQDRRLTFPSFGVFEVRSADDPDSLRGEGYASWRFPTSTNPHIPPEELEEARAQLAPRIYRQEFEAEFLEDGSVFEGFMDCVMESWPSQPQDGHLYVAGIDWGKYTDYTAVIVGDATTNEMVDVHRFQGRYTTQVERIASILTRWKVKAAVAESTSSNGWRWPSRKRPFASRRMRCCWANWAFSVPNLPDGECPSIRPRQECTMTP